MNARPSPTPFEWILETLLVNGHEVTIEYDADSEDNLTRFLLRLNGHNGPAFAGENLRIIGEIIIDSAIEGAFKRIDGAEQISQENASDEIKCPGCRQIITPENAGGYRTFCMDCVKLFPDFPTDGRSYVIEINSIQAESGIEQTIFKWVGGGGVEPIEPWPRR